MALKRLAVGLLFCGACSPEGVAPPEALTVVLPEQVSLVVGIPYTLTAEVLNASGGRVTDVPVAWSSRNESIATVDESGVVTPIGAGTAIIVARAGTASDSLRAAVRLPTAEDVAAVVLPARVSLVMGSPQTLTAELLSSSGSGITGVPVAWSSRDEAVATVDHLGTVTPIGPGTAIIVARAGAASDSVPAAVRLPAASVGFDVDSLRVLPGGAAQAEARARNSEGEWLNALNPVYHVADTTVVVPASYGWVTGRSPGRTLFIASIDGVADTIPLRVELLRLQGLSIGERFGCGLSVDAEAWCWGENGVGQLGARTYPQTQGSGNQYYNAGRSDTPLLVTGGHRYEQVASGSTHSCGLTPDGTVYCWGGNQYGQLGTSTTLPPCRDLIFGLFMPCTREPQRVEGPAFAQVATLGDHACALAASGEAWCWGRGEYGQLGNDTITHSPVPVPVSGGIVFSSLAAGGMHTCGLTPSGEVYCWGVAQYNTPAPPFSSVPVKVATSLRFTELSGGAEGTCGLTAGGAAYCWGAGSQSPQQVPSDSPFRRLARGGSCAITVDGIAQCWSDEGEPSAAVADLPKMRAVDSRSNGFRGCGMAESGLAYCWAGPPEVLRGQQ